jgi:hypothetical protein
MNHCLVAYALSATVISLLLSVYLLVEHVQRLDFYPQRHWFRFSQQWNHETMVSECPNYVALNHSDITGPSAYLFFTVRGDGLSTNTRFRIIRTDRCFGSIDYALKQGTSYYYWFKGCEYAAPEDTITIAFQQWKEGRFVVCEPLIIKNLSHTQTIERMFDL